MARQTYNTRYKSELSPRQREVLDLIAAGRTNSEIGLALGISLDGAKYHVSEVLAKVGASTREEAAAWWRGQNRPLSRLRARLAGIPLRPLFVATGFGGGLACAAAAVVLFFPGLGNDAKADLPACPAENVVIKVGTSLADKSLSATISIDPFVTTPMACAIDDEVIVTLGDRTGSLLAVEGNDVDAPVHMESRPVAFVLDANRDPALVTPGPSVGSDVHYAVGGAPILDVLWTNWCGDYAGPVTVTVRSDHYKVAGPAFISNPPRCVDSGEPSKLRVVTGGG